MKRKILLTAFVIAILVCAMSVLASCTPKKSKENIRDNVSRRTDAFFAGENDLFAVSIERGRQEKVFIADGKATDVVNFCRLTVTPLKAGEFESVRYLISGESGTLGGELTSLDYGEFGGLIELAFVPKTVTVTAGDKSSEIELANVLDGALSSADAVNIAKEAFGDRLAKETEGGAAEREIYVKLITGDRMNYFYYVSFIGAGVDYWAMLINPKTGEIVSKR